MVGLERSWFGNFRQSTKHLSSGRPALLPALPIQYADFAQWQRQSLKDKALEEQLGYWKNQLENLSILKLPSDRPRPAVRTFKGARQSFTLPEDILCGTQNTWAPGRRHPFHDVVSGISDVAAPLHGTKRYRDRVSHLRSEPQRSRKFDRFVS